MALECIQVQLKKIILSYSYDFVCKRTLPVLLHKRYVTLGKAFVLEVLYFKIQGDKARYDVFEIRV